MTEQIIPAHFGRIRRWWYTRFPLDEADVCPETRWKHRWPLTYGFTDCTMCGKPGYIEYGR